MVSLIKYTKHLSDFLEIINIAFKLFFASNRFSQTVSICNITVDVIRIEDHQFYDISRCVESRACLKNKYCTGRGQVRK